MINAADHPRKSVNRRRSVIKGQFDND